MTYKFCVVDNGLYFSVAQRLARLGNDVWYYSHSEGLYPTSKRTRIGDGFDGIERIDHWVEAKKEPGIIFIFPDVRDGALQLDLEEQGFPVWGSRMGEQLELYRDASKKHLASVGIPVSAATVVIGMDALEKHLERTDDQGTRYVKVDSWNRGDCETFGVDEYKKARLTLNQVRANLGIFDTTTKFYVEPKIKNALELAYDGLTIDGWWPKKTLFGIECKDLGYVGQVKPYAQIPAQLRDVNEALTPTFRRQRYRQHWSCEMQITKDGQYRVTDPTARVPSPPGELELAMIANIDDVYAAGAGGEHEEPKWIAKFGVELLLKADAADTDPTVIDIPTKDADHVTLYFPAKVGDDVAVIPQGVGMRQVGAVVAWGDTMEAPIKEALEIAGRLRGDKLEIPKGGVDDAKESFENLKSYGVAA